MCFDPYFMGFGRWEVKQRTQTRFGLCEVALLGQRLGWNRLWPFFGQYMADIGQPTIQRHQTWAVEVFWSLFHGLRALESEAMDGNVFFGDGGGSGAWARAGIFYVSDISKQSIKSHRMWAVDVFWSLFHGFWPLGGEAMDTNAFWGWHLFRPFFSQYMSNISKQSIHSRWTWPVDVF